MDEAYAIGLDNSGNVLVTGRTKSSNFPTSQNAFNQTYQGDYDVFVSKLSMSLNQLKSSTYIGGTNWDEPVDLVVDKSDVVHVVGRTRSPEFPSTSGAFSET